jgi:predicted secreted protein
MASLAISGKGTLLKIGEVKSIGGPSFSSDTNDVTSHSSPGAWREFIASLIDPGDLSFDINFVPTNATHNASTGLLADFQNRVRRNFKIVFPDGGSTTWSFQGIITGFNMNAPIDDALTASVTIKITGQPTLA